ncbi:MAG: hypothetical protein WEK74_15755 [Hydrogenophaga sp.]
MALALALGQWLIWVGDRFGLVPFAMVSVMFSFALLPITMTEADEPLPVQAITLKPSSLCEAFPMGMAAALALGLIAGAFYGLSSVVGKSVGFSDAEIASLMAATMLVGVMMELAGASSWML